VRDVSGTSVLDYIYKAILKTRKNKPQEAERVLSLIGSHLEYVNPDLLIDSFCENNRSKINSSFDASFNSKLGSVAVYNLRYKEWFIDTILDRLAIKNQKDFDKAVRTLDFLWAVSSISHYESYAENHNLGLIQDKLKELSENPETNYFIKMYVDQINELSRTRWSLQTLNFMDKPKETAQGVFTYTADSFGWVNDFNEDFESEENEPTPTGLYVSNSGSYEKIKDFYNNVEAGLEDPQFFLENFHKLNEKDINVNEQVSEKNLEDFELISGPFFRRYIEKDLGIQLQNLSLPEQFQVLEYMKSISVEDMKQIKKFNTMFSYQGFKTFLSIAHGGQEMGNKILTISENLLQEQARDIFSSYSDIVDNASLLQKKTEGILGENLSLQIFEALLVKAKDILLSAEYISSSKNNSDYTIENLQSALKGIHLQMNILNDLAEKKKYEYQKISENNQTKRLLVRDPESDFEYDLRILARPRAEKTAEARISLELGFDTNKPNPELKQAFEQEVTYKKDNKKVQKSSLRFSIDRETKGEKAHLSLDFGSSQFEGETFSRTGDMFGNSIALISEYGSHTPQTFSEEFADEETFAKLVQTIQEEIKKI